MRQIFSNTYAQIKANFWFALLGLAAIGALALFLQLHNVSNYKFYPDSYVNLVVSKNITDYGSVVGKLGTNGMVYPDVFFWTRPMYPILIAILAKFKIGLISAAYAWNLLFSISSIVLVFLLTVKTTKSKPAGLLTALIFAISYNRMVWSGFILTEATAIFFFLLFLYLLHDSLERAGDLLDIRQLLAGVAFSFLVLTRYEFAVLILPLIFLVLKVARRPWVFLLNFGLSALFSLSCFLFWLSPLPFGWSDVFRQSESLAALAGLAAVALAGIYALAWIKPDWLYKISILILLLLAVLAFVFRSLGLFVRHDFLLAGLFAAYLLIPSGKDKEKFLFTIFSLVLLGGMYLKINPQIERYWADVLPLLVIPVAFVTVRLLKVSTKLPKIPKAALALVLIGILAIQGYVSFMGLHKNNNGIWFSRGYEEVAAEKIAQNYPNSNLLLVSFPEPYYIFTNKSVLSISDSFPYVYADDSVNADSILIVEDYGMVDQFPNFTVFLRQNLGAYRINSININTKYRFADRIVAPDQPVEVYEIKVGGLKRIINGTK